MQMTLLFFDVKYEEASRRSNWGRGMSWTSSLVFLLCLLGNIAGAFGHAYLMDPPSRNLVAANKGNFDCPHCLNTGGTRMVKKRARGHYPSNEVEGSYGVCGDPVQNEVWPDKFAEAKHMKPTEPYRTYIEGQIITIAVVVNTHHYGHYTFSICDEEGGVSGVKGVGSTSQMAAQKCFDRRILKRVDPKKYPEETGCNAGREWQRGSNDCQPIDPRHPERWYQVPKGNGELHKGHAYLEKFKEETGLEGWKGLALDGSLMHYWLPKGLTCRKCTLQWHWVSANQCLPDQSYRQYPFPDSSWCIWCKAPWATMNEAGCGRAGLYGEEFRNCADISIRPNRSGTLPGPPTLNGRRRRWALQNPQPGGSPAPSEGIVPNPGNSRRRRNWLGGGASPPQAGGTTSTTSVLLPAFRRRRMWPSEDSTRRGSTTITTSRSSTSRRRRREWLGGGASPPAGSRTTRTTTTTTTSTLQPAFRRRRAFDMAEDIQPGSGGGTSTLVDLKSTPPAVTITSTTSVATKTMTTDMPRATTTPRQENSSSGFSPAPSEMPERSQSRRRRRRRRSETDAGRGRRRRRRRTTGSADGNRSRQTLGDSLLTNSTRHLSKKAKNASRTIQRHRDISSSEDKQSQRLANGSKQIHRWAFHVMVNDFRGAVNNERLHDTSELLERALQRWLVGAKGHLSLAGWPERQARHPSSWNFPFLMEYESKRSLKRNLYVNSISLACINRNVALCKDGQRKFRGLVDGSIGDFESLEIDIDVFDILTFNVTLGPLPDTLEEAQFDEMANNLEALIADDCEVVEELVALGGMHGVRGDGGEGAFDLKATAKIGIFAAGVRSDIQDCMLHGLARDRKWILDSLGIARLEADARREGARGLRKIEIFNYTNLTIQNQGTNNNNNNNNVESSDRFKNFKRRSAHRRQQPPSTTTTTTTTVTTTTEGIHDAIQRQLDLMKNIFR
mmetsp:Transcript_26759/g.48587  ORF Transcript_26759/g.48587 Transcript_26759/m.48587 type:complete len:954 (-) Transcript_26759:130-2991(-)